MKAFSVQCEYTIKNQWTNGFVASISLTNTGNEALNNWEVKWSYQSETQITSSWNAVISGNNPYRATNNNWNGRLAPGATIEFGVQGRYTGNTPEEPLLNGATCQKASNRAPTADITLDKNSGTAPLAVGLDGSRSSDPDDDQLTYQWLIGNTSVASGKALVYTFSEPGDYDISLTVSDGKLDDTQVTSISVDAPVIIPSLDFSLHIEDLTVTVKANEYGPVADYFWAFGDFQADIGQAAIHTYDAPGTYTILLDATLADGSSVTVTKNVNVIDSSEFIINDSFEDSAVDTQPDGWHNFVGWVFNSTNNSIHQNTYALVDDTRAFTGKQSVHFKGGMSPAQIVQRLPVGTDKIYMKAMVYMTKQMGNVAQDNHEHIMGIKATQDANNEVRFGQAKGHLGTNEVPSDNVSPKQEDWFSGPMISANAWHCVELALLGDKEYDTLYAWVDDELVHTVDSADDWNNGRLAANWLENKFNYVMFGWHSFSGNNIDVWMDDIVVSKNRVGCP